MRDQTSDRYDPNHPDHVLETERTYEERARTELDATERTHLTGNDAGGVAMTRHEEELFVTTRPVVTGRLRLSKRVVTEERTVVVRREELVVEEIPVDEHDREQDLAGNPAKAAAVEASREHRPVALDEHGEAAPVHEIVLHEERVVTQVIPVERVRVFVDRVTREETVSADLAKEVVEVEHVAPRGEGHSGGAGLTGDYRGSHRNR
ncbi:DUF2382 domain-containing protein [Arsenicicoccus dermatophilus]|uniref:DUF2382 domain-containing protein n=1 Tax=Arsenicicoccus dermatophilus TaxID=1076331 RepID=UPI001F4C9EF6|nr:DUF2382 domain-containing protein [Arsenicicoccus dermatophilus]MCH8611510.1 YsnF/AvaK domain-containing protein [Arsenicicoccus dermatophilus]